MKDLRFPPKRILVPLDLSEASMGAWAQAQLIADEFRCKVEALYVQPWLDTAPGFSSQPFFTTKASRASLAALKEKLGPKADVRVVPGVPVDTVLGWDRELGFDLIVMGTHGRTGWERLAKGSVAEAVTRDSKVPVLVCRGKPANFKKVLAPVHFEDYARKGAGQAAAIAKALGARLTLLHVCQDGRDERDVSQRELEKLAAGLSGEPSLRTVSGEPIEAICQAAEDFDLVVLVAHRKRLLESIVLGTTVERVIRHGPVSVLALPCSGI